MPPNGRTTKPTPKVAEVAIGDAVGSSLGKKVWAIEAAKKR